MAKILVVGSRKAHDETEFRASCQAIGEALARHGHTIVAAGCGDDDAETWVLDGANRAAGIHSKAKVIPFAPAVPGTQDLIQTGNVGKRWPNLSVEPPFETKGPWAVGQAVALIRSDAALLLGGGILTANVGSLALELGKPYYAVSALGGAAKTVADEDLSKHKQMGMPTDLVRPQPASAQFGEQTVKALEFLTSRRADRTALRKNGIILAASAVILGAFLAFLFRDNLMGNEPRLVYTTCLGALAGVMLSFLVGHVAGQDSISLPSLLGQVSLASFLGVLYGFFALEAGAFYKVDVTTMQPDDVNSLAIKLAVVGVGVGALLGPASTRVLDDLRRTAKL